MRSTVDTLDSPVVQGVLETIVRNVFSGPSCFLDSYEIVHLCSVQFICIPVLT